MNICENCGKQSSRRFKAGNGRCFACQPCSIEGCKNTVGTGAKQMCISHYARAWNHNGEVRADEPLIEQIRGAENCVGCGIDLPDIGSPERRSFGARCRPCHSARSLEWKKRHACSTPGCERLYSAKGYCGTCLYKLRKYGDATHVYVPPEPKYDWSDPNTPTLYMRDFRARKMAGPIPEHTEGSAYLYATYGCRCRLCTDAQALAMREWKFKTGRTQVLEKGTCEKCGFHSYKVKDGACMSADSCEKRQRYGIRTGKKEQATCSACSRTGYAMSQEGTCMNIRACRMRQVDMELAEA